MNPIGVVDLNVGVIMNEPVVKMKPTEQILFDGFHFEVDVLDRPVNVKQKLPWISEL